MSALDWVTEIEQRAEAATPGPWQWAEAYWNERIRKRSPAGRRSRSQFVYRLQGPMRNRVPEELADEFDYYSVLELRWYQVRGTWLGRVGPSVKDATFIAHARTDVPRLCRAVREMWDVLTALDALLDFRSRWSERSPEKSRVWDVFDEANEVFEKARNVMDRWQRGEA